IGDAVDPIPAGGVPLHDGFSPQATYHAIERHLHVGRDRVNRVTYEIAVLEALRERLRCKEIWVVGANRYR
ncbi:hypothetical protein, partial [Aeromonas caviae]|uniref:hypothetical protein n=1 Tax=Aeromonas caviae TaxID=648 RepID=UPI001CC6FB29